MSEPSDLEFVTGSSAARAAAEDPFWSTVVRRHGDVDIVILPPGDDTAQPEVPPDEPAVDPAEARQVLRAQTRAFWSALGLPEEPSHLDDVWFAGAVQGTLRWQGTATFDDLDPAVASGALERALPLLPEDAGWHVLVPPEGIPRVLAGRPGRFAREEVQVLLASASRLVVRLRSDLVVVGEAAAAGVLRGEE